MTELLSTEVHVAHLERLRQWEMASIPTGLLEGRDIVEIGGGSGFQAALLAPSVASIRSFDIATPDLKYFPVELYDGYHVPVEDDAFNGAFSSNALEHVPRLNDLLQEILRILSDEGVAVVVLPTSTWRLWTSLAHYPFLVKYLLRRRPPTPSAVDSPASSPPGLSRLIRRVLSSGPHGENRSALHELVTFSERHWRTTFSQAGFAVDVRTSGLFYTGYSLIESLSVKRRHQLGRVLGSSSKIYVLRPLT